MLSVGLEKVQNAPTAITVSFSQGDRLLILLQSASELHLDTKAVSDCHILTFVSFVEITLSLLLQKLSYTNHVTLSQET